MTDSIEPSEKRVPSQQVIKAVEEAQMFISYVAWKQNLFLNEKLLATVIEASNKIKDGEWSSEIECRFWIHFDRLAEQVGDVTIESLKATLPGLDNSEGASKGPTRAVRAVSRYRRLAYFVLFFLLAAQVYWFVGKNLTTSLKNIDDQVSPLDLQVRQIRMVLANGGAEATNHQTLIQLEEKKHLLLQQHNANYDLLQYWNQVWLLSYRFAGSLEEQEAKRYEVDKTRIKEKTKVTRDDVGKGITQKKVGEELEESEIAEKLRRLNLRQEEEMARNEYFLNELSAEFVLSALQSYLLPLLYGWLGATIFVLRSLTTEIKEYKYSSHSDIRFRLRLSVGPLGGMIIGWFFTPSEGGALAYLGPLAIAFLTGYNIDLLFSVMDKAAASVQSGMQEEKGKNKKIEDFPESDLAQTLPASSAPSTPAKDAQSG